MESNREECGIMRHFVTKMPITTALVPVMTGDAQICLGRLPSTLGSVLDPPKGCFPPSSDWR